MRVKKHYHGIDEYVNSGIKPFVKHASAYLLGKDTIPASITTSLGSQKPVTFTFTNTLLEEIVQLDAETVKAYEVAIKYGFRGFSRGGKNGIVYVRKGDAGLSQRVNELIHLHEAEVIQDLDAGREDISSLKHVKIVAHTPSGRRIVGAYNSKNNRMIFLDHAKY